MSAFKPRTTATGNLPHLSNIQRKPEPLGTEFKATMCATTNVLLFLEIQKGKLPMRQAKYTDELRLITAATTMRLCETALRRRNVLDIDLRHSDSINDNNVRELFLGDSWFASIEAAINIKRRFQSNFIGVIKTSHAGYCRKFLEDKMKEWPAGSHLVLESSVDGVDLLAVGYKYNRRKVTCFIATKGAGHTENGQPYEAKWKDDNGNTRSRDVPRPEIISKYFNRSNGIDVHNQSRQGDLHLEKNWITADVFFRIVTTLFALTITDVWKVYCFHLANNHRHKKMKIIDFVKILSRDLVENSFSENSGEMDALVLNVGICTNRIIPSSIARDELTVGSSISTLTSSVALSRVKCHDLKLCSNMTNYTQKDGRSVRSGQRRQRGKCMVCGTNTSWICQGCSVHNIGEKRKAAWCCNSTSRSQKRPCLEIHRELIKKQLSSENGLTNN